MDEIITQKEFADGFVKAVRADIADVSKAFFHIGFRLWEARLHRYYEALGYENIIDCAEALFGFKKSTTYDMINVYMFCRDNYGSAFIKDKYRGYSQSQLIEFTKIRLGSSNFIDLCSPEDSVLKIREARKIWDKACRVGPIPFRKPITYKSLDEFIETYKNIPNFISEPKKVLSVPSAALVEENKEEIISAEFREIEPAAAVSSESENTSEAVKVSGVKEEAPVVSDDNSGRPEKSLKNLITDFLFEELGSYNYELTLDFARICYGIELKIGDYVLSPGNNYFDFEVSSGKTGVGGVSSCRYILSDTYTIDYYTSEQALAVVFSSSPSKINGTISANAGTGKDNVYLWVAYPNEHTLGDTVTLDRDFIESMNWCGRYDEDSNNPAFVSSSLTDAELTEVLNTSKESGNDCLFGFWVTDFQNQTEEYYYINYNYIDVPVESVSLDNDNVVVNN